MPPGPDPWMGSKRRAGPLLSLAFAFALALPPPAWAFDWQPFAEADVVEILTHDEDGAVRETKVWIVVLDGSGYVRTNDSRWLVNIRRGSDVSLRLDDATLPVQASESDEPALREQVEVAFREKYGFMQRIMSALRFSEPTVLQLEGGPSRTLRFGYEFELGPVAEGPEPLHVFVPLAQSDDHQRVLSREVTANIPGALGREDEHGNLFWHGELAHPLGETVQVRVDYEVERFPYRKDRLVPDGADALSVDEQQRLGQYLDEDRLVPVNHPVLAPALAEIRRVASVDDSPATARAIYDWLVDNLEYKKVGTGWGNGDVFWACSERYGNCTDFHSLFNALARSSGIPARFEIGFPIPEERGEGRIGGYHCWAQFYLPGAGWVPVDASEAFKYPERRDDFYGGQGADRIRFTTGRDLKLGPAQRSGPLNYFIYPHVERGGETWPGPIRQTFHYADVGSADEVEIGQRQN